MPYPGDLNLLRNRTISECLLTNYLLGSYTTMREVTSDTTSIRSIAVIGSGLAGLTAAILLGDSGHNVRVFEKSRGPGGRLASKRVANGSADIGAQYFTSRNPGFTRFLDRWAGPESYQIWNARFGYQTER